MLGLGNHGLRLWRHRLGGSTWCLDSRSLLRLWTGLRSGHTVLLRLFERVLACLLETVDQQSEQVRELLVVLDLWVGLRVFTLIPLPVELVLVGLVDELSLRLDLIVVDEQSASAELNHSVLDLLRHFW